MEYLTATELSKVWNISTRRIGVLCTEGRVDGAIKKGKMWLIPDTAQKPADARYKKNKQNAQNKRRRQLELEIIDNVNKTLKEDLTTEIHKGSKVSIAAACFSIYAFAELKKELKNVD